MARATLVAPNEDLARRLSERSGGYPKLIDLLGEVIRAMPEAAEWLTPQQHPNLVRALRKLLGRDDGDVPLRAIALPRQLGFEGADRDELNAVAKAFDLSSESLERAIATLSRRGLLGRVSSFVYVTPEVLADWLAGDLWTDQIDGRDLFRRLQRAGLSGRALASVLRRLAGMGAAPATVSIVRDLLADTVLFGSVDDLDDEVRATFVNELATLDPKAAVDLLRRLLRSQPRERLLTFEAGRREAVRALVKCAWAEESFADACETLLALADAENESYGNNATGVFLALFQTFLGGTEASGKARIDVLNRLYGDSTGSRRLVVVRAALSGLEVDAAGEVSPFPASLRNKNRWRPASREEEHEYRTGAAQLAMRALADPDAEVRTTAADGLIDSVRSLFRRAFGELAEQCIRALPDDKRMSPKLFAAVDVIQKYDAARLGPEQRDSLRRVKDAVAPRTLAQRLRLALTRSPWDDDGEAQKDDLNPIAREFLEQKDFDRSGVWTPFVSPDSARAFDFGRALGAEDHERAVLELLTRASAEVGHYRALAGYLQALSPSEGLLTSDELLDEWAEARPELADAVFEATWLAAPSERGFRRLARMIATGALAASRLGQLMYGGWLLQVPLPIAVEAIRLALNAPAAALGLAYQLVHDRTKTPEGERIPEELAAVTLEAWLRCDAEVLAEARGTLSWQWGELGRGLAGRFPSLVVERVLGLLDDRRLRFGTVGDSLKQILREAAASQQQLVWNAIGEFLDKGIRSDHAVLVGELLYNVVPVSMFGAEILAWVGTDPVRARVAARFGGVPAVSPDNIPAALLERFTADKELRAIISAKFFSGGWSGPMAGYYEAKLRELEAFLRSGRPGLSRWAEELIPGCKSQIKWARDQDERWSVD